MQQSEAARRLGGLIHLSLTRYEKSFENAFSSVNCSAGSERRKVEEFRLTKTKDTAYGTTPLEQHHFVCIWRADTDIRQKNKDTYNTSDQTDQLTTVGRWCEQWRPSDNAYPQC